MILRTVIGILLILLNSCTSYPQKNYSVKPSVNTQEVITRPATEDSKKQIAAAKKLLATGKKEEGFKKLIEIQKQQQGTDVESDVDTLIAAEYWKRQNFVESGNYYFRAATVSKLPDKMSDNCKFASMAYEKSGDFEKAFSALDQCQSFQNLPNEKKQNFMDLKITLIERKGDPLATLRAYTEASGNVDGVKADQYRSKALQMVQSQLSEAQLEQIADDSDFSYLRGHINFRLGVLAAEAGDTSTAISYFNKVKAFLPETDLAESADQYINNFESLKKVNPYTVGAVLPLSGKYANIGQRTLRGIQMGFGLTGGITKSNFSLAVIDSEDNSDQARRAVDRLTKEDNVIAIIGSLLSKTASTVAAQSQHLGVPSIALSQKAGVTETGNYVFQNALTSEIQVRHLARYAMKELGLKKFAIMYPNDKFGTEFANLFWDEVMARGGEIRAAQTYDPQETDFRNHVQRLVGLYYPNDRSEEFNLKLRDWKEKNKNKKSNRNEIPEDLLSPVVDFDALLIADNVKTLGQIAPMLAFYNVRGIKILGPNIWNTPAIVKRVANTPNEVIFIDNIQSTDVNLEKNEFVKSYKNLFGEIPGAFEVQGYDSAVMIKEMINSGAQSRASLRDRLSEATKINGALSSLKISKDREVLRPMIALTVSAGEIKPISNTEKK